LISKKNRYWGLALPIYECKKCRHFAVIGSKAELKKRAVQGWDKFIGHTPHKPWIDEVKIKCSHCGETVSRIDPVGNPWLDAGIVPFSTLPKIWFPADFITEAFPGQFKNWFYAMLVMSTVLQKTNPFQTVLGYESVVGEDGRPMHKSWGNAIEFNQGAQKIGVDAMRWMYAKVLPTAVLPFGYKAGAEIVGTGRSDFANQVNNALAFPGLFRAAMDARVKITDKLKLAAVKAIVKYHEKN